MQGALVWLKANQEFSGWAQTFGALLALFVALIVPWIQHAALARRERFKELEGNIYLSLATMLLIRDAQNFSSRVRQLAGLPKAEINDPLLVLDLLERLRTLDAKDMSVPRQASQYVTRAAVLRINHFLDSGEAQTRKLTPQGIEMLERDALQMENEHSKLRFLLDELLYRQTCIQISWLKRPLVWWSFKTKAGRKWLEAKGLEQEEALKEEMQSYVKV